MQPFLERAGLTVNKMQYTLKLLLLYEHWYMSDGIPCLYVVTAQPVVNKMMTNLQEDFPRAVRKKSITIVHQNSPARKKRAIGGEITNKEA